jgi:hypothetical protein
MTFTYGENIVSDLHKDARGYRPREIWWKMWERMTPAEKQVEWDILHKELEYEMNQEAARESASLVLFQKSINDMISLGAGNTKTAIKWLLQSEGFDDFDLRYGPDYVAFRFGFGYADVTKFPLQEVINEMLEEVV